MPIETIESASQPRNAQFFHTESIANGGKSDQTFSHVSIRRFLVISFLRYEGENESSPVVFEMSHLTHFFVLSFQFINASEPSLEQQSNPGALSLIGRNAMCQGLVTGEQITNDLFHGNLANRRRHRWEGPRVLFRWRRRRWWSVWRRLLFRKRRHREVKSDPETETMTFFSAHWKNLSDFDQSRKKKRICTDTCPGTDDDLSGKKKGGRWTARATIAFILCFFFPRRRNDEYQKKRRKKSFGSLFSPFFSLLPFFWLRNHLWRDIRRRNMFRPRVRNIRNKNWIRRKFFCDGILKFFLVEG